MTHIADKLVHVVIVTVRGPGAIVSASSKRLN